MKRSLILASLALLFMLHMPRAQAASCLSQTDLGKISSMANDTSTDYLLRVRQELDARRGALKQLLNCGINDAADLKASLGTAAVKDKGLADTKEQILSSIDQSLSYYYSAESRLNDLGIRGTKDLALEILNWRQNNYLPLSEDVKNFIIWNKNQELFARAQGRLNQMRHLLGGKNSPDIQTLLGSAEHNWNLASQDNSAARDAFHFFPLENNLDFIKSSLQSLSALYKNFYDLGSVLSSSKN